MRREYDFSGAVRGVTARRYAEGVGSRASVPSHPPWRDDGRAVAEVANGGRATTDSAVHPTDRGARPQRHNGLAMERTPDIGTSALPPLLVEHRAALLVLAKRRGLRNVRVFGSMARGDHHAHSDVDLLVDAPPGTSALALCGLSIDAEQLLNTPVDVVTEGFLYPSIRERAVREAIPL